MSREPIAQINIKLPARYRAGIERAAHESRMTVREWMQTMLDDVLGWAHVETEDEPGRADATAEV